MEGFGGFARPTPVADEQWLGPRARLGVATMNRRAELAAACLGAIVLVVVTLGWRPVSPSHHAGAAATRSTPGSPKATANPTHQPKAGSGPNLPAILSPKLRLTRASGGTTTLQPSRGSTTPPASGGTATPQPSGGSPTPPPSGGTTRFPIRAAFFYPWYPESWYPTIHFTPTLGAPYNSSLPAVLQYQIAAMEYANIDVAIASWWGPGTPTDQRIPLLLNAASGTALKWALYYEPAPGTQSSDLSYIYRQYASNPNYEHVNGKPVLFVYSRSVASCADAANWVNLNAGRFYLDLQVFGGYTSCATQPDSWHQYGPASLTSAQLPYSYSVSPGYWKYSDLTPTLARSTANFEAAVEAMDNSGANWQLITTWNEWGEGTAVEDAAQWQSADGYGQYVDILHANG